MKYTKIKYFCFLVFGYTLLNSTGCNDSNSSFDSCVKHQKNNVIDEDNYIIQEVVSSSIARHTTSSTNTQESSTSTVNSIEQVESNTGQIYLLADVTITLSNQTIEIFDLYDCLGNYITQSEPLYEDDLMTKEEFKNLFIEETVNFVDQGF